MNPCSHEALPGWLERVEEAVRQGDYEWLLSTPGSPLMMHCLGIRNLSLPGYSSLTLGCCGHRLVEVNDGGLYTELEHRVIMDQWYPLKTIVASFKQECRREPAQEAVFSPLGWPSITPLRLSEDASVSGCVELESERLAPPGLEPLQPARPGVCRGSSGARGRLAGLNPFEPRVEPVASIGGLSVIKGTDGGTGLSGRGWLYLAGEGTVEIEHPYLDVTASILVPARFVSKRIAEGRIRALALSVGGTLGSLALASAGGMSVEVEPGLLRVAFRGGLRIARGGPLLAARLLHEGQVVLGRSEVCGRGLGHIRASGAVPLLVGIEGGGFELLVYSPAGDGHVEVRSYAPMRRVRATDILGSVDIPGGTDSARIPAPWGCVCIVRVETGSLLLRFRRRSRGRPA